MPISYSENETSIVGGGITGLYAALRAVDNGQTDIHVYEASPRLGGKIKSQTLHERTFSMGAEFIDSDDDLMIKLCDRLGLALMECPDQKEQAFQGADGKIDKDFFKQYAPIAWQIIRDRQEVLAHPNGKPAQHMSALSVVDYFRELRDRPEFVEIPASVFRIALDSFAAEVGQSPEHATAEQFIAETMLSTEKFLVSDCVYRVEGGTEAIITTLHTYLEEHGVRFHLSDALASVTRRHSSAIDLEFTSPNGRHHVRTHRAILGLPAYALANVDGLESFGLQPEARVLIGSIQYANLIKFTVPVRPGMSLPEVNLFSADVQSYPPADGYMTFLCHSRGDLSPSALVRHHLSLYAHSLGKAPEEVFNVASGGIAFENPDKLPCFSTPSPHRKGETDRLLEALEGLADHGLAIVGTYFPLEGAIGFMECGLASVERAQVRLHADIRCDHSAPPMRERITALSKPSVESLSAESFGQRGSHRDDRSAARG